MTVTYSNCVAMTGDWIGGTEGQRLTSYDLRSLSTEPNNSISMVFTQARLELRSANRSLRDKAREEMSDFEREYPW